MKSNEWKESDIYKLNIDRKKLLSEDLCILFEKLAVHLFVNQTEICNEEEIIKQVMLKATDENTQQNIQALKKYINLEKDTKLGISFLRYEYQMYYLSSWITRNLCDIANNRSNYSFDTFFEIHFTQNILTHNNIWCLQKFGKSMKDYFIEIQKFKYVIFEYINICIAKRYFYCDDGVTFDLSKETLFVNTWGIIKSYYHCQNPINTENKHVFTKLIRDFFNGISEKLDIFSSGINLAFMDFSETDLSETTFYNTDFTQTNFYNANLDDVTLDGVKLVSANFDSAFMEVSGIYNCDCSGASFKGTHLLSSVIDNSDLCRVDFRGTNLMECDIKNTSLKDVRFDDNTALNSSIFINIILSQIDLTGVSISQEQMKYFWENTTGVRDINVYGDEFKLLSEDEQQTKLYDMLVESLDDYLIQNKFTNKAIDIFISHATLEKIEIAMPIYEFLKSNGYTCWIDNYEVEEDKLRNSIETGIQNCQSAVIILSSVYKTRAWTKYELLRIIQESQKRKMNIIIIAYHLEDIRDCPIGFKKLVIHDTVNKKNLERLKSLLEMDEENE